jgi:molecular chaperone DnaK (HSP70)
VAGSKTAVVFDMGGGTTDLTVMRIENGVFHVQSTGGNNTLGGKNLDQCLLKLVLAKWEKVVGVSFPQDEIHVLLKKCRACKVP